MKKDLKNKKEIILYIVFGVLTTAINYSIYFVLTKTFLNPKDPLYLQTANAISWALAVLFAFITNRRFVFKSRENKKGKELVFFFLSRAATLIIDAVIMAIGVSLFGFNDKIVKVFSQIIVIILNYLFSKLFVFKNGGEKE